MHRFGTHRRRRWVASSSLVAMVFLLVSGASGAHAAACTQSGLGTVTITCTPGAAETWTVPGGITEASFDLRGAGGGASSDGTPGGAGDHLHATLSVTPGTTYEIAAGQAGGAGSQDTPGSGGATGGATG